jgi:hypothetical protein
MMTILDPAQRRVSIKKDIYMYTFLVSRLRYVKNAIATSTMASSFKAHLANAQAKRNSSSHFRLTRATLGMTSLLCVELFWSRQRMLRMSRRRKEVLKKDPFVDPTLGPKSRIGGLGRSRAVSSIEW